MQCRQLPQVIFTAFIALTVLAAPTWAWGDTGHRVVGRIAALKLTPAARTRVAALLGVDDDVASVSDAMADAAVWADHVARTRFPESADWHFIDLSLKDGEHDADNPFSTDNTAPAKIVAFFGALKSGGPDELDEPGSNLMLVVHFVGDIHQPLHTATDQDRGANCINVKYPMADGRISRRETLHHAWDSGLLEDNLGSDDRSLALHFVRDFDTLSEDDQKAILFPDPASGDVTATVHAWVMQSHQFALTNVYAGLKPAAPILSFLKVEGHCTNAAAFTKAQRMLDSDYVTNAATIIDQQLLAGGIRLAALLNAALGSTPGGTGN
jgi:S1/P1 Nuclease